MPIYAYRCSACGRAKDVLQKMSDPVLTDCPFCGEPTFVKQVTAAGFQLKGSGWYVTDFRGDSKAPKAADGTAAASDGAKSDAKPGDGKAGEGQSSGDSSSGAPAASPAKSDSSGAAAASPAPSASSPAGGSGSSSSSSSSSSSTGPASK